LVYIWRTFRVETTTESGTRSLEIHDFALLARVGGPIFRTSTRKLKIGLIEEAVNVQGREGTAISVARARETFDIVESATSINRVVASFARITAGNTSSANRAGRVISIIANTRIGTLGTTIALFSLVDITVTAERRRNAVKRGRSGGLVSIVADASGTSCTTITLFSTVKNTVTANGYTVGSGRGGGLVSRDTEAVAASFSSVALLSTINCTITANACLDSYAINSDRICGLEATITSARNTALCSTIAVFSIINDTVTAKGGNSLAIGAGRSSRLESVVTITSGTLSSSITFFKTIYGTITAKWDSLAAKAGRRGYLESRGTLASAIAAKSSIAFFSILDISNTITAGGDAEKTSKGRSRFETRTTQAGGITTQSAIALFGEAINIPVTASSKHFILEGNSSCVRNIRTFLWILRDIEVYVGQCRSAEKFKKGINKIASNFRKGMGVRCCEFELEPQTFNL
jgi:hypothetical protein